MEKLEGVLDIFIMWCLSFIRMDNYYLEHPRFQRFAKYGLLTTITFWIVKSPLILLFDWLFNDIVLNFLFFVWVIPSYLLAAFIAGVLVTLLGFVWSEWGIWKK